VKISHAFQAGAERMETQAERFAASADAFLKAVDGISSKLSDMQTPDHIIEIKLNPAIQGMTRAVNAFSKGAADHTVATGESIKQLLAVSSSIASMLEQIRKEMKAREAQDQIVTGVPVATTPQPSTTVRSGVFQGLWPRSSSTTGS
jgi:hypothetical protein